MSNPWYLALGFFLGLSAGVWVGVIIGHLGYSRPRKP